MTKLMEIICVLIRMAVIAVLWKTVYADLFTGSAEIRIGILILLLYLMIDCLMNRVYESFLLQVYPASHISLSLCLAAIISDTAVFAGITLLSGCFPAVLPMLCGLLIQFLWSIFWAYLSVHLMRIVCHPKKTVVIYGSRNGIEQELAKQPLNRNFEVEAVLDIDDWEKNHDCLSSAECIFLNGVNTQQQENVMKYCLSHDIACYVNPDIGSILMNGSEPSHFLYLPILHFGNESPHWGYFVVKRVFDICLSSTMLFVLSPLMLAIAVAIRLTDGGPVFYRQVRLTKDGKEYRIFKFRSMYTDAEKDGIARLSTGREDDRVTPVGRLIRKYRLDELGQLLNIWGGSMTFVGPRPERPELAAEYEKTLPEFRLRLKVKAGLTGYAQVYGKYNTTPEDKLKMDLLYISDIGFMQDLRILLMTAKVVFIPESTEGVTSENSTPTIMNKEKVQK